MPMTQNTIEKYEADDEFQLIDPKKVDKDNESFWRIITVPAEIELFPLKWIKFHFRQSEQESTPFTTEPMKQKFDQNASTDEAQEVLKGNYNSDRDVNLDEIIKQVLTNCL